MSRERNLARNGTGSKSKRETKEEMDGQCGRMVGIIKRKLAARNRGQERMEKNRLQCDQPSYRGRLKRERERERERDCSSVYYLSCCSSSKLHLPSAYLPDIWNLKPYLSLH